MALFGKKKEETKAELACCCNAGESVVGTTCCGEKADGICCIKILGAGCKSCHEQYENTRKAVEKLGLDIEVEYITDMEQVMSYGVMSMPALLVNNRIVSAGKVLRPKDIETLIGQSL